MCAGRILALTIPLLLFPSLSWAGAVVSTVPSDDLISQDELIDVDVWLSEADDLNLWAMRLEVTGGDSGCLELEDLFIDDTRFDYVFYGHNSIDVVVEATGDLFAYLPNFNEIDVTAPAYLGTFQYRASSDATGVFNIRFVNNDDVVFIADGNVISITLGVDNSTFIGVEVDCLVDAHCDDSEACTDDTCDDNTCVYTDDDTNTCTDGNDCTSDACESGVCTSTNETSGTSCDDGLYCTATDECDGSGTCVGSGATCTGQASKCCECSDTCIRPIYSCFCW